MSVPAIFLFGDAEINLATFELRRSGVSCPIEPQVFELLAYLARNPNRLITRDELIEQVWGGRIVSDSTVASRLKSARRAVGDDGEQQKFIRTVHGRGVRFVGNVVSQATASPPTQSTTGAYQYYLIGRSYFLRSGREPHALRVARQMFGKAIEIDPSYARAYAGIANCDSYLLCMGDPTVHFEDILANSGHALSLDPELAEAHAAKGLGLYMAGRNVEAEGELEQALRKGPELFEAHYFAARNQQAQGHFENAAALFESTAEKHPGDYLALGIAAASYRSIGRLDNMHSAARRCLERVGAEIAVNPGNVGALAFGACVQAEMGDKSIARTWIERAARAGSANAIVNYNLACAYAALGQPESALRNLDQVFAAPSTSWQSHLDWIKHDSSIDLLREHAGFQELLRRIEAGAGAPVAVLASQRSVLQTFDDRPAIAVLPFENLSNDTEQDNFADGLTEDIITDLSRVAALFVAAHHSVFALKGKTFKIQQAAADLGVGYILEGTVRKAGDRIRVTCLYRKLDSSITVMQSSDHGLGNDPTQPLDRSADRRVFA